MSGTPPAADREAGNQAHQHDLSAEVAAMVVRSAVIGRDERVLEVGAGHGALTACLLTAGAHVVAVERDPERSASLRRRFAAALGDGRLTILEGDALRIAPTLTDPWRVLANPPFSLTAPLVRRWLLEDRPAPVAIDLVLQREAALKLTGSAGAHTRSSVIAHLCGTPRIPHLLPRTAVTPPSRVDLAVWCHRRSPDAPPPDELMTIDRLLESAFAGPRTMSEALRGLATGIQIRRQAQEHGWHPDDHPRALGPAAWRSFARLLSSCGRLGRKRPT
jgi:23S rRNA (adenine-N6)-dimethyltransferase